MGEGKNGSYHGSGADAGTGPVGNQTTFEPQLSWTQVAVARV
jgi:hypothetical protein